MIEPELRQLQQTLNQKADAIQHDFTALSEQLTALARRLLEARGVEQDPLLAEQAALRQQQQALAEDVNLWRDRARAALRQPSEEALRGFVTELLLGPDRPVSIAAGLVLHALDHPEEAGARAEAQRGPITPAGRLLERARTDFDLRGPDPAPRQREAVEFANRPGLAQDDAAVAELEAALEDTDPLVGEVAALTLIQLHRFRALRLSDLDAAHASVRRLARFKQRAVVPALIEILQTPRTGFVAGPGGGQDGFEAGNNLRSRLVALAVLVEWRSPLVQAAVRSRQHDRDPLMVEAANRALDVFPGEWS